MDQLDQEKQTINSLRLITRIFYECQGEYRVLGSVLIVSQIKKIFRRINDMDILLDKSNYECVLERLEQGGFTLLKRRWGIFEWIEAEKENYLGLTFLLVGKFTKNHFSYKFLKFCELRIRSEYLQPTKYHFGGVEFIGIPLASAMAGINQAFLNPKRALDKQVLEKILGETKAKTYNNISVYIAGIKIPFLYDIFSFIYNIYGGIRVILGKKYEAWD